MENSNKKLIDLEKRIAELEDKQRWQDSYTRKITISVITYLIILSYSCLILKNENSILNSVIPVLAYIISTLTVNFIKRKK